MGSTEGTELPRRPSDHDIKVAINCLENRCVTDCSITVADLLEYTKALEHILYAIGEGQ